VIGSQLVPPFAGLVGAHLGGCGLPNAQVQNRQVQNRRLAARLVASILCLTSRLGRVLGADAR
jgi:hypothetical protein